MRTKGTRHRSYEAAVAYLTRNPHKIEEAWGDPFSERGGSLFVFTTTNGKPQDDPFGRNSGRRGCLTQLKASRCRTIDGLPPKVGAKLLKKLKADDRIPSDSDGVTVESLLAFAEWQDRLDKAFEKGGAQ